MTEAIRGGADPNGALITRRRFLASTAAAVAAPMIVPASVLGRGGSVAPSERIVTGHIGIGSRGNDHLRGLLPVDAVQIGAVCDVFRSKADGAKRLVENQYAERMRTGSYKGCAAVQDFREITSRGDIDAVIVAAPENWHALMSVEALRNGKDVYCEKALSLTVAEGRDLCAAVRRHGRVFQAGTQQRSDTRFRHACELALNGYLGKLHTVTVGVPGGRALPVLPVKPVPEDLDYELWLGPAPFKPYRDGLCSYNWYFVTDYCAGWIQSWGVHHMDIALWGAPALLDAPLKVKGSAVFPDEGTGDVSYSWKTSFTASSGLALNFHSDDTSPFGHGVRFEGDKGWVHVVRGGIKAEPKSLLNVVMKPADTHLYRSQDHQTNFLECIRSRREPAAPVEVCHAATTMTLVADIATRTGREMTWDPKAERFAGDDPANRLLSRAYRSPWHL